jgi:hypothetical protein
MSPLFVSSDADMPDDLKQNCVTIISRPESIDRVTLPQSRGLREAQRLAFSGHPNLCLAIEQHLNQSATNGEVYPHACDSQFQFLQRLAIQRKLAAIRNGFGWPF